LSVPGPQPAVGIGEDGAVVGHVELSVPGPQPAVGGLVFEDGGRHDGSLGLALQSTAGGLLFEDGGRHDGLNLVQLEFIFCTSCVMY
jgi:hypothetical protein